MEYTLFWIKPDAFMQNNKREHWSELKMPLPNSNIFINDIVDLFNSKWCLLLDYKLYKPKIEIIRNHYFEHLWKFDNNYNEMKLDFLTRYLLSWDSYWMIFCWEDVIKKWREILTEIRYKYLDTPKIARYNMTHASDSEESARREILLHFPNFMFEK